MVKKIFYTVLILIGIVFIAGYFRYNPAVNFTKKIPVYADAVIRVNLRDIEYTLIKDVVKHPFLYFKSTNSSSKNKAKLSLFDELKIPANLLFTTNYSNLKNTWISSAIHIKDKEELVAFFMQEKYAKQNIEGVDCFFYKNRVYILNNDELTVLLGFDKISEVEEKIKFILQNNTYLKEDDASFMSLKNSTKLVAVSTKKNDFFEIGIDEESLSISGVLSKENNLFLTYQALKTTNSLMAVSGRIKGGLLPSLLKQPQKSKFKKLTTLSLDSIATHWDGGFDMQLDTFVQKNDTVVIYEYDDDFNKIEKQTIQKSTIPDLRIKLGGTAMFDYLVSKDVVKTSDGVDLLILNPLFKTYARKHRNDVFFTSNTSFNSDFERDENKKFSVFFDVDKYMKIENNSYIFSRKYLSLVKNINGSIAKNNEFKARIYFKTTPLNYVFQLVK